MRLREESDEYREGWEAWGQGKYFFDRNPCHNPYDCDTEEYRAWLRGNRDHMNQEAEDEEDLQ